MCYTTLHTLHYTTLHYLLPACRLHYSSHVLCFCHPLPYTSTSQHSTSTTTTTITTPSSSTVHTAAALRPRRDCIDCPAYIDLMVPDVFIGSSFDAITKHPAVDIKSNSLEPGTSPSSTWAADRTLERSRPSRIAHKTRAGAFPLLGRNHTPWLG